MSENKYVTTYMGKSKNAFQRALRVVPIKTGNLRYNATKYERLNHNRATIRIDLAVAPYARYIDQPGYRTHGWFDKFRNTYIQELQKATGARRKK